MSSVFRSAYSPKLKVALTFPSKDRTKQSFKSDSDVNNIVAKFRKTGLLEFVNRREGQYADVSAFDFQRSVDIVARGKSLFHELPAHVRDYFGNEPAAFLEFVNNPNNQAEAERLGLVKPEAERAALRAAQEAAGESGGPSGTPPKGGAAKPAKPVKNPPSARAAGGEDEGGA